MKIYVFSILCALGLMSSGCSDVSNTVKDTAKNATSSDSITIDGMTLEYANMPDEPLEKPLEIVKEPKVVAMTSTMTVAVKADGTLWTWGSNANGRLLRETNSRDEWYTPAPVKGVTDAVALAASGGHVLVLKKDGTVWGWGDNGDGQINPNIESSQYRPLLELTKVPDIQDVVDIAAGSGTSLFVTKSGSIYMLGENAYGLANDNFEKIKIPTKIKGFSDIVKIDGDGSVILALNKDGELYSSALTLVSTGRPNASPRKLENNKLFFPAGKLNFSGQKVANFSLGSGKTALLSNGYPLSWGFNSGGTAAQGNMNKIKSPQLIHGLVGVVNIDNAAANTFSEDVYIWGSYAIACNMCPMGSSMMEIRRPVKIASNFQVKQFVRQVTTTGFLADDGSLWFWGQNRQGTRGTGSKQTNEEMPAKYLLTPEKSLWNYYE